MKRFLITLLLCNIMTTSIYAAQSTITEAEGSACMGDDKSRKQTQQAAFMEAKKKAVEFASTYIKTEAQVKNFVLEKDLVSAYANAEVKTIQELEKTWYKDASSGDCYKMKIKAEVVPDIKAMESIAATAPVAFENPSAPLSVKAWTDKKEYKQGDKIKIYIKGNKPFYARVLYKDASGELVQLLPNPHRTETYFNGSTVYEIPSGNDRFDLEVAPPFGEENVLVYASTSPLGEIGIKTRGSVYEVKTKAKDIGIKTRGVKIAEKSDINRPSSLASEFYEEKVSVSTTK